MIHEGGAGFEPLRCQGDVRAQTVMYNPCFTAITRL
jgi:hypothetical protein